MKIRASLTAWLVGAALVAAPLAAGASSVPRVPPEAARAAQVVFLGENHDNPAHHAMQAEWVAFLQPTAIVFEMLTSEQAASVTPELRGDAGALEAALGWEASGWPDFGMYHPIFTASPEARVYGAAIPRAVARELSQAPLDDVGKVFAEAGRFGLDQPLPAPQMVERVALQAAAHCDKLPEDLLPKMVMIQRVRDAELARVALQALADTVGPVVVITGNGHAREDWGAPYLLRRVAPDVAVFSLGQGEAGQQPSGGFDLVIDGPGVDRGDPCDAFK